MRPLCLAAVTIAAAAPSYAQDTPVMAPSLYGPLTANPSPLAIDTGILGTAYVTGAVAGLGFLQDNRQPGDLKSVGDISDAEVFVQKVDGAFQYFIHAGAYSLPSLGTPYLKAKTATSSFYGPLPQAYIKLVGSDKLSVQIGKMLTLIGAENTFTFQNRNVQRGLLWNQTPGVMRAVQMNYTSGPLAVSLALNDGFYSNRWSWLAGTATYTVDPANAVTLYAAKNLSRTHYISATVPLLQNNQQIYTLLYTHTGGPWTFQPYVQYSRVPRIAALGMADAAKTYSGALWAQYDVSEKFSVPVRLEYIDTKGSSNLLYGPGSHAWSVTVTPTLKLGRFFARLEGSYVRAGDIAPGAAFGLTALQRSQSRAMIEAGVLF